MLVTRPRNSGGNNLEPEKILDRENFSSWPLTADDLRRFKEYCDRTDQPILVFEHGVDYITPEMKRADVSGIFDGIPVRDDPVIPSTRDELFIKGKLD